MDKTKLIKLHLFLVFLYFAFFPFGQIFKLVGQMTNLFVPHPTDIILLLNSLVFLSNKDFTKRLPKRIYFFVAILIFVFLQSLSIMGLDSIISLGYFVRLVSVCLFSITLYNLFKEKILSKGLVKSILIVETILISILGFIQYLLFADLRQLYFFGWDDHLSRLTSTFLDPAFAAALLGLGIILVYFSKLKYKYTILLVLFLSLLLTYSRASFLALIIALMFTTKINVKNIGILLAISAVSLLILFSLGGIGEGVNLLRTNSIILRMENFKSAFVVIKTRPLFGIGYQFGFDNSVQTLWAATGLVGVLFVVDSLIQLTKHTSKIFLVSFIFIFIHGLFNNTFFYPWVIVWLGTLAAIEFKEKK